MFKKLNKKGFTLAELLIVVAIIGVLVAISIPIFTSQLEKAREAVDLSNIRAAYAECSADVLTNSSAAGYYEKVDVKQQTDSWVSSPDKIAGTLDVTNDPVGSKLGKTNKTVYVNVSKDGAFTLTTEPAADFVDVTTVK
ncbi:MAG: prepilin-type N-terminal cleavage/methylation domain-containing protein [Oribacterium sp.]|nr:prepilin-type N-terminal cleavage/methylation domain-containing protein [Oribacterium sp.]